MRTGKRLSSSLLSRNQQMDLLSRPQTENGLIIPLLRPLCEKETITALKKIKKDSCRVPLSLSLQRRKGRNANKTIFRVLVVQPKICSVEGTRGGE